MLSKTKGGLALASWKREFQSPGTTTEKALSQVHTFLTSTSVGTLRRPTYEDLKGQAWQVHMGARGYLGIWALDYLGL